MRDYVDTALAEETVAKIGVLEYPDYERNAASCPFIKPVTVETTEGDSEVPTRSPSNLIVEAVGHLGHEPKRILDLGSGVGPNSLYLASLGHKVLALDSSSECVEWANERAKLLGIEKNYVAKQGDATNLSSTDRYDGIVATMLLHYFEEREVSKFVGAIQSLTLESGLNVISAFTEDNPTEELSPGRGLKYLLKRGELRDYYSDTSWQVKRAVEGHSRDPIDRGYMVPGKSIIPCVAEIIARKRAQHNSTQQTCRTYMNANREIIYCD